MGSALGWAITAAALAGVSTTWGAEEQRKQQKAQSSALRAQAQAVRQQNEFNRAQGEIEAQNIDRQKIKLRREFQEGQGHNRSLLAAGNVDMASGSAMDVSLGNINRFAEEMGENRYSVALKNWETNEQARQGEYQAKLYDSQASYLRRSAGSFGLSLLKGGLSAAAAFASAYAMGSLAGGGNAASGGKTGSYIKLAGADRIIP